MNTQRWKLEYGAMYRDELGEVCLAEDVSRLEASYAELLEAAKHFVDNWEFPAGADDHLRDVIAKAEGTK